jgi:hypothetical protein
MFLNISKKTFTLLCSLLLIVVFIGTSCKKNDDKKTTADYLSAHDWKLTSTTLAGAELPIDACSEDDVVTFHEDGELHFDEGATKCDEADPQETTGEWSVSDKTDPETLTFTYTEDGVEVVEEFDITEVSDNKLVLTIEVPFFGTIVNTYEKI